MLGQSGDDDNFEKSKKKRVENDEFLEIFDSVDNSEFPLRSRDEFDILEGEVDSRPKLILEESIPVGKENQDICLHGQPIARCKLCTKPGDESWPGNSKSTSAKQVDAREDKVDKDAANIASPPPSKMTSGFSDWQKRDSDDDLNSWNPSSSSNSSSSHVSAPSSSSPSRRERASSAQPRLASHISSSTLSSERKRALSTTVSEDSVATGGTLTTSSMSSASFLSSPMERPPMKISSSPNILAESCDVPDKRTRASSLSPMTGAQSTSHERKSRRGGFRSGGASNASSKRSSLSSSLHSKHGVAQGYVTMVSSGNSSPSNRSSNNLQVVSPHEAPDHGAVVALITFWEHVAQKPPKQPDPSKRQRRTSMSLRRRTIEVVEISEDEDEQHEHHTPDTVHEPKEDVPEEKQEESKQTCVFLVRHGERQDHIDEEWILTAEKPFDPPLSERGMKQAHEVGLRLKKEGAKLDAIYCSPLYRTLQTAAQIADVLEVDIFLETAIAETVQHESVSAWEEKSGLPWPGLEMMSEEEIKRKFKRVKLGHKSVAPVTFPESEEDLYQRIVATVEMVSKFEGKTVLLCSHQQPVEYLGYELCGGQAEDKYVSYCCLSKAVKGKQDMHFKLEYQHDDTFLSEPERPRHSTR
eukprot:g59856.t1